VHLRTANPIESTFATVRHRSKTTKVSARGQPAGHGIQAHRVSAGPLARRQGTHLVALVRAGATFTGGKLIERPGKTDQPEAA
jgi:hypothetical protein